MNRLVIIGNGFDLAHGLKTSYGDFINYYINNMVSIFNKNHLYEDNLISLEYNSASFQNVKTHSLLNFDFEDIDNSFNNYKKLMHQPKNIKCRINSRLFKKILSHSACNWVDIEKLYFDCLKTCKINNNFIVDEVNKLNTELSFLKQELIKYLTKVTTKEIVASEDIVSQLKSWVPLEELSNDGKKGYHGESSIEIDKICFLNFNYTKTVEPYLAKFTSRNESKYTINYMHGKLEDELNHPIFGYGDEHEKEYIEFEHHNINELFHNIKSFEYFKTSNYSNLIDFIDGDEFQVYVYGHSLGISDRTLFKEIFENTNCLSIKIFYYQKDENTNDYTEKTYNISRHFTNKIDMRNKVVSYDLSEFLPQNVIKK